MYTNTPIKMSSMQNLPIEILSISILASIIGYCFGLIRIKKNKIQNILLVVNKSKSFDKKLKGDFNLDSKNILSYQEKNFIYTGCQIINKNIFSVNNKNSFSIIEIWNQMVDKNKLYGFESLNDFIHVTDIEIFNKLSKNY